MIRSVGVFLLLPLALGACSREPPPPPEKTVFEAQIKAIGRAKAVEKLGLERKDALDRRLDQDDRGE